MDKNKKNIAVASVLFALVFGVVGYFIYADVRKGAKEPVVEPSTTTDTEDVGEENGGDAVITLAIGGSVGGGAPVVSTPIPSLVREIRFPASLSAEQKESIGKQIAGIVALLKQDASLFNEWSDLGLLRKEIEDYEGAREAWEYASILRPQNSVSFVNLGVLYGYYLKDPVQAEKNYLKALENDPKLPYLYVQIADFYLEVMGDKSKARAIIERGIREIPGDEGLKSALEMY